MFKIPVKGLDAPLKLYITYVDDALDAEEPKFERRNTRWKDLISTVKRK